MEFTRPLAYWPSDSAHAQVPRRYAIGVVRRLTRVTLSGKAEGDGFQERGVGDRARTAGNDVLSFGGWASA